MTDIEARRALLDGQLAIVFVHVSKSAGTTVKRLLAESAGKLGLPAPYTLYRKTWPSFLKACRNGGPLCRRALYAGTNTLGACEYIQREHCLYVTVLRNPIRRLISSWHYFCVRGSEKKKGWYSHWKQCEASILDWAQLQPSLAMIELSTNQSPVIAMNPIHQTSNCHLLTDAPLKSDRDAHLAAALTNTAPAHSLQFNVPIRTLILENLESDLSHLSKYTGLPFSHLDTKRRENQQSSTRLEFPRYYNPKSPEILRKLHSLLHYDIILYNSVAPSHLHVSFPSSTPDESSLT